MIIGIGTDIVYISRIQKSMDDHGDRFLKRCFTARERKKAQSYATEEKRLFFYAKRWAAKEAC